jgi:N-acetylneuraminic acid mutarotase
MSQDTSPYIQFDSDLFGWFGDVEDVDVSINGGQTWANVWQSTGYPGTGVTGTAIPLPMAAGQPDVQVRFHYVSNDGQYWELDNVFIGNRSCDTIPGGMLEGTVTDGNTGGGVNGAAVTSASDPAVTATTAPADPSIGDGFYYLFAPGSGSQSFTAAMAKYASTTKNVTVAQGSVTTPDLVLQAGQLAITPASVSETVALGSSKSSSLTFKNTGKAPADVKLYGDPGSFSLSGEPAATDGKGAPLQRVKGAFSPMSMPEMKKKDPSALKALSQPASEPADGPWTTVPDYPLAVVDNAAATDPATGLVYSVGGITSSLVVSAAAYVYNPSAQAWTALPPMQVAREAPSVAFINGELYVTGGWGSDGNPVNSTEIYDPAKQTWSAGASEPIAVAGAGTTVLGDEMYVIGGCDTSSCTQAGSTQVYDPISDSWSAGGAYPTGIAWEGCGAISGDIFCAGGTTSSTTDTADAYEYDPGTQTWSSIAPIPIDMWAMGYAASNGELLLSGGVTDGTNTVTNQGFAYDVADGSWTALPNSDNTDYRGGSACGMYRIAGTTSGFEPESDVEELPGYGSCQTTDVPWMSETADTFTVQPGASQTVTVTLNAGDPSVAQPGTYTASLLVSDDSPYLSNPVGVSMNVTAPSTWGKIMGTVTGDSCGGTPEPLQGATVQIDGPADYTLKTDQSGDYALWLAQGTLTVIVAKNGWTPTAAVVKITKGQVTTADYTLKPASC